MARSLYSVGNARSRVVLLSLGAPLERSDLPGLIERTCALLEDETIAELCCEVRDIAPDAVAVDALAQLALAARRRGCRVWLSGASRELLALVRFMGLEEVLGA
jgi:ABC-type transporter Mla MlaB component